MNWNKVCGSVLLSLLVLAAGCNQDAYPDCDQNRVRAHRAAIIEFQRGESFILELMEYQEDNALQYALIDCGEPDNF